MVKRSCALYLCLSVLCNRPVPGCELQEREKVCMGNMSETPASRPPGQHKAGRAILTLPETSAKVPTHPHSPHFCSSTQSTKARGQGGLCSRGRAEIPGEVSEGGSPAVWGCVEVTAGPLPAAPCAREHLHSSSTPERHQAGRKSGGAVCTQSYVMGLASTGGSFTSPNALNKLT